MSENTIKEEDKENNMRIFYESLGITVAYHDKHLLECLNT